MIRGIDIINDIVYNIDGQGKRAEPLETKQETETMSKATELVRKATQNPQQWQSDGEHDDEIVFANGIYTIGSNGDTQDADNANDAAKLLAQFWNEQDND